MYLVPPPFQGGGRGWLKYLTFTILATTLICSCKSSSTAPQLYTLSATVQAVDTTQSTYDNVITHTIPNVLVKRLDNGDSTLTGSDGTFTFLDVPGNQTVGVSLSTSGYATSRLYTHVPDSSVHSATLYPASWLAATLSNPYTTVDTAIDTSVVGVILDSAGDTTSHGTIVYDTEVYHNSFDISVTIHSIYSGRPAVGDVFFYISTHDSINPLDPNTFDFIYNDISDSGTTAIEDLNISDLYTDSHNYTGTEYPSGTRIYCKAYVSPYKRPRSYSYPGSMKPIYPFLGLYPSNTVTFTLP
jgi:hypothetical protein